MSKFTTDDNAIAQKFFQQAIDHDPTFAAGYWGLASAQFYAAAAFQRRDLLEERSLIEALARQAVELDSSDAEARSWLGATLLIAGDYEGALAEAETALAMSPNLAMAHAVLGSALIYSGRPREGLVGINRYLRLDPRDPRAAVYSLQIAIGHYFCHEYGVAVEAAKRVIRSYPGFPLSYRWLPAALGQLGRIKEAKKALAEAMAFAPGMFDMYVRARPPWFRPEDHSHMLEGLRKAGWSE